MVPVDQPDGGQTQQRAGQHVLPVVVVVRSSNINTLLQLVFKEKEDNYRPVCRVRIQDRVNLYLDPDRNQ